MRSRAALAPGKLGRVETISIGELVTVGAGASSLAGIVFDVPSRSKVVVAVVDPNRGPQFRTVNASELTEREQESPDDQALRLLIRRTPPPVPGAARGAVVGARGRSGFSRGSAHRPTGR
jgi:hypothetical protein